MGCASSHSEDLHRTSLLESDKFVTSLQDVPGYFSRTIHTSDFLPPKFPDAPPERPEMSYTGPPSHLRNSVDFHPYWHLMQRGEYQPSEMIRESSGEVPQSLLPHTETAQELRDIEVREAITDLRQRVRDSIAEKLRENEEDFIAVLSGHGTVEKNGGTGPPEVEDTTEEFTPGTDHLPPPLPREDYMDGPDNPLAQDEKDTIDFLDSVINESMAWDEETGEELFVDKSKEGSNWSFSHPPPRDDLVKDEVMHQGYDPNKPLPGVNLDIATTKSPNSPMSFGKSIYIPEDKNTFISNNVLARQTAAPTKPRRSHSVDNQHSPARRKTPQPSPRVVPPPPKRESPRETTPRLSSPLGPSLVKDTPDEIVAESIHSSERLKDSPTPSMSTWHDSSKTMYPPPPPPPPPSSYYKHKTERTEVMVDAVHDSPRRSSQSLSHVEALPPPMQSPPQAQSPPSPTELLEILEKRKYSAPEEPAAACAMSPLPAPQLDKTELLEEKDSLRRGGKSAPPPPPATKPRPRQPPGVRPKPARHSMIELPTESTILEDLPSDDSGIKEEVSERSLQDIIKNLKLTDSAAPATSATSTLDRKFKGTTPPPTARKPKPTRPKSMPPPVAVPVVKPKPQRKGINGAIPNGRDVGGRNASFGPKAPKRHSSDDASSEDSGLHMKEDPDVLNQIQVEFR